MTWVRLAPKQWREGSETEDWLRPWLEKELADRKPDALAIAMQYVAGAKPLKNAAGLQIAGDADFGPLPP